MAAIVLTRQIQQLDQISSLEERIQLSAQTQFIVQAQLDVDAVNAIGVFGHAVQGNHHVFIDFEGVGVPRNGRCTLAVEPKFFARIGVDCNKAFTATRVGNAHHFRGGFSHGVGVVSRNVANEHHFGQTTAFALGGVTHSPQVTVVQVLQTRQQHLGLITRRFGQRKHVVFDFHNAGHSVSWMPKKLQAHGAGVGGHAVQHPACAGDQAVTAFFLNAGQTA